ncbi:MAG: hypothetical protein ACK56I_28460, partial [bacterium]
DPAAGQLPAAGRRDRRQSEQHPQRADPRSELDRPRLRIRRSWLDHWHGAHRHQWGRHRRHAVAKRHAHPG